ncbi:MAG: hypothetical protein HY917_05275 [Candidatus Diapherotrites archaeon]|nr:hypothetical protein [Candidatus Diapherotrites archaeon]
MGRKPVNLMLERLKRMRGTQPARLTLARLHRIKTRIVESRPGSESHAEQVRKFEEYREKDREGGRTEWRFTKSPLQLTKAELTGLLPKRAFSGDPLQVLSFSGHNAEVQEILTGLEQGGFQCIGA